MLHVSSVNNQSPDKQSVDSSGNHRRVIHISLVVVLALSLTDLIGWAFDLTFLKSISGQWIPMKIITAISFALTAVALFLINLNFLRIISKYFTYFVAGFLFLISLLTIFDYFYVAGTGNEPGISNAYLLRFFLPNNMRMAFITAMNFFLISWILFLLEGGTIKKTGTAHTLVIPVLLIGYLVPLSYLLGVHNLHLMGNIPVALNTGIAFCAVCIAILFMEPDTWLMKVYTSRDSGQLLAKKLLPTLMALPMIIGWMRITGERKGTFSSEEGVVFVAATYTGCFLVLVWLTAKSFNIIDTKRKVADDALRKSNEELLERIKERDERTNELMIAEKELQSTKNYLENLINYANAPIIVWDPDTKIQLFNHAFENLTGYCSGEIIGKQLDILFPKATLNESNAKIRLSLIEKLETVEIPIMTKVNEIKTVLWNSANIYGKNNKTVLATIAQGQDITQRIAAEQEVLKSKEKLDLALENGNIGIWELDIKTYGLTFDKRFKKMFGMENESLLMNLSDFEKYYIHPEDSTYFHRSVDHAIEADIALETVFRTKPGKNGINHISIKSITEKDSDGLPAKMSGVCFDITEMKKGAEKTLFQLNEELIRSNRELEQFAYVASHDLQEPLRMVSSFTQMLARRYKDKLDDDANEFIQFAVDGAFRMQSLINDLLEYSRVGTKGKNPELIDLHVILGQAISNLGLKIKEKNALITNDDLPEIFADGRQMQQLFQNLIDNALKFSNSSPIIHISSGTDGEDYLFSVQDNGIGIEPQYYEKIFQIFQRLHAKEDYPGTGIGLAICRRIVERHGGKIWVESKPGEGTKFFFTIINHK